MCSDEEGASEVITISSVPRKKWWAGDTPTREEIGQHLIEIATQAVEEEDSTDEQAS